MPKGFTEHEKQLIGARLLEEGARQFSLYGLKKTSVEELAAAAGISKGAFYLFHASKEALFMDVAEEAERNFRREVLAAIDLPGPSPRARLLVVLQKAFTLWKTIPVLQIFTSSDYAILARRIPGETLQEHLQADRKFVENLISSCRQAGIPVCVQADEFSGLLHALFFTILHENDFGTGSLQTPVDILLELVAAFCLGEVKTQKQTLPGSILDPQ
jgi:AcrR family transcriptional regulator